MITASGSAGRFMLSFDVGYFQQASRRFAWFRFVMVDVAEKIGKSDKTFCREIAVGSGPHLNFTEITRPRFSEGLLGECGDRSRLECKNKCDCVCDV